MADFAKARSGSPYNEGAAVTMQPVIASPSTKIIHVRGFVKNWAELFEVWKDRFKNYLYYKCSDGASVNISSQTPSDIADGQPATVSYTGVADSRHVIYGLAWSYEDTPTGGRVTITSGSDTIFDEYITTGGPGFFLFDKGLFAGIGEDMVITLADGGVDGTLNIFNHDVE